MVTGGNSRPHACAISLNSSRASEESPPRSKKLSSTEMDGTCSTCCQIGVSTSAIVEVGLSFTLHLDSVKSNSSYRRRCEYLTPCILAPYAPGETVLPAAPLDCTADACANSQ